jgi:tetratricopeptide (TPR) repeat protein
MKRAAATCPAGPEALNHESLPNQGPGRSEQTQGNVDMVNFKITAHIPGTQPRPIEVSRVAADHYLFDLTANHWIISRGQGRSHTAVYLARQPVDCKDGTRLEVQMEFLAMAEWPFQNLGRFRLSVSHDPAAFDGEQTRFAAMKLKDPWAKLAVAYAVNGRNDEATRYFTRALERSEGREARRPILELGAQFGDLLPALIERQPDEPQPQLALARGLARRGKQHLAEKQPATAQAELAADDALFQAELAQHFAERGDAPAANAALARACALFAAKLAQEPENTALAADLLSAYQSAGRTREAVPYLAKVSALDPSDMLLLQVAALQAWFGQEKELAATRQRILAFAKDTNDSGMAERAAKACSIRMSTRKVELDAALALARKAVELDHASEWRLLALGMAEYRCGNDAAAIEALLAAVKAAPKNAIAAGLAGFYRAMSLSRQGKSDEARKLAIETAAQMQPLPKDEQNPLADGAYFDTLILWLAYKEAKAMIHFDPAPAAPETPGGK